MRPWNYRWSPEALERELRAVVGLLGRMPSCRDLIGLGRQGLAVAIGKHGGYAEWAKRLRAPQSDSASRKGRAYEDHVGTILASRGYSVTRQATKAPFDLLLDDRIRVDVKGGDYHSYPATSGGFCSGYFFQLHRTEPLCDFFILCCGPAGDVKAHYIVPASKAHVQTITITPSGRTYVRFREAWDLLSGQERKKGAA